MHKGIFFWLLFAALIASLVSSILTSPAEPAKGQPATCQEGRQASGARYRICLSDSGWSGDLVVYAHGYVRADAPLSLPGEAWQIGQWVQDLGYAFATTSYSANGLAALPAQEDLLDLVQVFASAYDAPKRTFLVGASEGGLITALSIERRPDVFAGGLSMCGPVGSFTEQIYYFGDFRVVFDAFFPGQITSDPVRIPQEVQDNWPSHYRDNILPLLSQPSNRDKLAQIFLVTGAPFDPTQPATVETTLRGVLGYNIFATNDASARLNGQPFGNRNRSYSGSSDDGWLNQTVQRIDAEPQAVKNLQLYETSGKLASPLVVIHTTGDEIVPYKQMEMYREKVKSAGRENLLETISVNRYGHCSFTDAEIQDAFNRLAALRAHLPPTATPSPIGTPTHVVERPTESSTSVDKPVDSVDNTKVPEVPVLARLRNAFSSLFKSLWSLLHL